MLEKLKQQLREDEGFRAKPYPDTLGNLTIGFGRNLHEVGISKEEANYLLHNDAVVALDACKKRIPFFETLDEARQMVLANMAFQMGIAGLLKFAGTLQALAHGDYELAANRMLDSIWARQTPHRAARLAAIMRGEDPDKTGQTT